MLVIGTCHFIRVGKTLKHSTTKPNFFIFKLLASQLFAPQHLAF